NVVGLDIGTSGVRAAEVSVSRGSSVLERFGQVALPPGAVRDGEVVDVDTVAKALKQLWSSARFSTKQVVLGVANQRVIVRQVDLPWLAPKEMRASLPFQVQDYIPIPVEQAVLDFHPLEEFTNEAGGRMLRMLLVAADRDMVNGALRAVQQAGLTPAMVDLTPFALLRSLTPHNVRGDDSHADAYVNVGASITNIVVHQGGVPRFVRILVMGGNDITDAVAERLGVPADHAEMVKAQVGMRASGESTDPAARVIEQAGSQWVEEVRGSLDYYAAQPGAARLNRIVLTGGGSQLAGLAERLSNATRLVVEPAAPYESLKLGKLGLSAEQLQYVQPLVAVPVGLAMGVA
ncbi:MAG: type IV pilus assembly protein PilM, partial [Mycobacteriales bacterium]